MIKVYAPPKEIKKPKLGKNYEAYFKAEEKYSNDIIDFCKKNGKGKYKGRVVRFPVADGYATYVVYSDSPMELIHDDSGDGYNYMFIERLTKKDIIDLLTF